MAGNSSEMEIIARWPPRRLFRYRKLSKVSVDPHSSRSSTFWARELAALNENYIWFSSFKSMNDPMEGSYEASTRVKKSTRYDKITAEIYYDKISLGICSFSETNNNGPMWAHYADEFHGICVEYDVSALLKHIDQNNPRVEPIANLARVTYSEDRYRLSVTATDESDVAQQILSVKSHRWLHEREWRLFRKGFGKFKLSKSCVSHVYLGNRMSQLEINQFREEFQNKDVPLSVMKLKGYSIEFEKWKPS